MPPLIIRPSTAADLPAITRIYGHAVTHGTGTFETDAPDETEMASQRRTPGGWTAQYMFALANSIAGGASNIQRNIIGERGLGLPRDLRAG